MMLLSQLLSLALVALVAVTAEGAKISTDDGDMLGTVNDFHLRSSRVALTLKAK